jgi:Thioredoxin.
MSQKILIAVVLLAALIYGYTYINQSAQAPGALQEQQPVTSVQTTTDITESQLTQDTRYLAYSPEVFERVAPKRRILFFYAAWCPTCIPTNQDFNDNTSIIPEDVSVIRVNYNDDDTDEAERDLARRYGVTYQHTFVQIDERGEVVTRWNGGSTKQLLANIK